MSYITENQAKRVAEELLEREGDDLVELLVDIAMQRRTWSGAMIVLQNKWERIDQELFGEDVA